MRYWIKPDISVFGYLRKNIPVNDARALSQGAITPSPPWSFSLEEANFSISKKISTSFDSEVAYLMASTATPTIFPYTSTWSNKVEKTTSGFECERRPSCRPCCFTVSTASRLTEKTVENYYIVRYLDSFKMRAVMCIHWIGKVMSSAKDGDPQT